MEIRAALKYTRKTNIGFGQGRNSTVWLVDDPQLGGELVIKEIDKKDFGSVVEFFEEAKTMFASSAPNVVPINYCCETPDLICLAMPYLKHGSLATRIAAGPLPLEEVIRVGQGVLAGLGRIHAKGFIHFDVKPTNVLFNDQDLPMVADFGQSKGVDPTGTAIQQKLYWYGIPPECFAGAGTVQSDIYQTGLTLYRAVNGDPMFNAQLPTSPREIQEKTCRGRFPDRNRFQPHVPDPMRRVIRKAMRINPADRYGSATEMADALGRVKVPLNWAMTPSVGDGAVWKADRPKQSSLLVSLQTTGGGWSIQIHTEAGGKRRAKDVAQWKSGLSLAQAQTELTGLFDGLA